MKRLFFLVGMLSLVVSNITNAKELELRTSVSLDNNINIFRINLIDEKVHTNRSMSRRIKRLERAVRVLQDKVFYLEDESYSTHPVETKTYICTLHTTLHGSFIGRGDSEGEARAITINNCKNSGAFTCSNNKIDSCEFTITSLNLADPR